MASVKVYWYTSTQVDGLSGTIKDFCAEASEALFEYLTDSLSYVTFGPGESDLLTAINGVGALNFAAYSRRQVPWVTPREGSEAGRYPFMYIWTENIGEEWRETQTIYARFRSRITIFTEHADMETARVNGEKYGNWIAALLHVLPRSLRATNWRDWYWNVAEPVSVERDGIELTGDEDSAEIYAHTVSFEWLHFETLLA